MRRGRVFGFRTSVSRLTCAIITGGKPAIGAACPRENDGLGFHVTHNWRPDGGIRASNRSVTAGHKVGTASSTQQRQSRRQPPGPSPPGPGQPAGAALAHQQRRSTILRRNGWEEAAPAQTRPAPHAGTAAALLPVPRGRYSPNPQGARELSFSATAAQGAVVASHRHRRCTRSCKPRGDRAAAPAAAAAPPTACPTRPSYDWPHGGRRCADAGPTASSGKEGRDERRCSSQRRTGVL